MFMSDDPCVVDGWRPGESIGMLPLSLHATLLELDGLPLPEVVADVELVCERGASPVALLDAVEGVTTPNVGVENPLHECTQLLGQRHDTERERGPMFQVSLPISRFSYKALLI